MSSIEMNNTCGMAKPAPATKKIPNSKLHSFIVLILIYPINSLISSPPVWLSCLKRPPWK